MSTKYQQVLENKYGIIKAIGKGEFGEVYLAENLETKQQVAIKQALKAELQRVKKRQELFQTEKKIMATIKNDNVIALIDHIETKEKHYLIMEYCNNGDLDSYIKKLREKNKQPLSEEQAKDFLKQLLNGFQGLQQQFVIHRDLKLKNVLVHDGNLKIADFGLSKMGELAQTHVGTPYTKAPEVFKGRGRINYTNKTDIWSLGVIFYQMLFDLQYPFVGQNEADLFNNIEKAKDLNFPQGKSQIKVSDQAKNLLRRMLTKDPSQRIDWYQLYADPYLTIGEQKEASVFDPAHQELTNKFYLIKLLQQIIQETLGNSELLRREFHLITQLNQYYSQFLFCKRIIMLSKMLEDILVKIRKQQIPQQSKAIQEFQKEIEDNYQVYQMYYENTKYNLEQFINRKKKASQEIDERLIQELSSQKQMNWQLYLDVILNYYYCLCTLAEQTEEKNETKAIQLYDHIIDVIRCLQSDSSFDSERMKLKSQSSEEMEKRQQSYQSAMFGSINKQQYISNQKAIIKDLFEQIMDL